MPSQALRASSPRGGAKPLRRRPKRNEALLPNTKGRGGEPPRRVSAFFPGTERLDRGNGRG